MSWPLVSDFSRMLQNPKLAFRDLSLRECRLEMDQFGQPRPRSGNFATVYRAFRPDGSELAIRVFNRREPERLERYQAVSRYLEQHPASCLVGFDYDDRGIRSGADGKLYPLLTMDWVPGVTLFEWARDRCREGYGEALSIGAEVWLQLVRDLETAKVVHGDLQHGNVLVSSEGYFKLVDYDCMGVPELMGRRTLEAGLPPYQHPGRDGETPLHPGLDNFSALVIYVALRALGADPSLWFPFVEQPGYDRLLFRTEDFQRPSSSPLYQALMRSADEQVRDLTHYLFQLTTYNVLDIPPVDEVLLWCNSLENLLAARDWDTALQLVDRMGEGEQIAPHLQAQVEEARRRAACRQAVEQAYQQGDEGAVERYYVAELLDDYPGAEELAAQARIAGQVRHVLEVLAAAQRFRNWDHFLATWKANQAVLVNRPSAAPFRREVRKLLTVESLRKLIGSPTAEDHAVLEAWNYLRSLGGHERAEPFRAEVERRLARQEELPKLQRALAEGSSPPTLASDRRIVTAWNAELFEGYLPLEPQRRQVAAARERLEKVRRLGELAKKVSLEGEQEIVVLGGQLPQEYHPDLAVRVQRAGRRLRAHQRIQELVHRPHEEQALVAAYEKLLQLKGEAMLTGPVRARVELARRRADLLAELAGVDPEAPPESRDQKLLEIWDEATLAECPQADRWRPAHQEACQRRDVLDRLRQAVEQVNRRLVDRLLEEPILRGFTLPAELRRQLEAMQQQVSQSAMVRRQALINALLENDRRTFVDMFDAETLRAVCAQFQHHQPVVAQWVEGELLPAARSGIGPAAERGWEFEESSGRGKVRWTWPTEGVAARCHLLLCDQPPKPHVAPEELPALLREEVPREKYEESDGWEVTLEKDWSGAEWYVIAVIDLGFQVFHTEPVSVARISAPPKSRRWGLFRS